MQLWLFVCLTKPFLYCFTFFLIKNFENNKIKKLFKFFCEAATLAYCLMSPKKKGIVKNAHIQFNLTHKMTLTKDLICLLVSSLTNVHKSVSDKFRTDFTYLEEFCYCRVDNHEWTMNQMYDSIFHWNVA